VWSENAEYVRKALDIPNVVILNVEDGAYVQRLLLDRFRRLPTPAVGALGRARSSGAYMQPGCAVLALCLPQLARRMPSSPSVAEGVVAGDPSSRAKDVVPLEPSVHAYAKE